MKIYTIKMRLFLDVILLIFLSVMKSQSEKLQLLGPSAPLVAAAGEDLVLPCFIKSNTSAVEMTVEWFKPALKNTLVHLYKDHDDRNENQAPAYRERTSLFKDELQKGNASLKLSALRVSDEGEYTCFIEDKTQSDDIIVNVIVEEKLQLLGPSAPLVAAAGEDLVLPCFIKSNTSAVEMTVEWFKPALKNTLVHLYKDHDDRNENQAPAYRERTSLFKDELQKGNASLKLSALRVSDEGEYTCFIEDKTQSDDIIVNVIVEAQGSQPVITMKNYDHSGGIYLVCESRGWNPKPEIVWLDREGDTLPAEDTQIHRDTDGFSVKRSITVHDYSDTNRFYCRLQQLHHMMETEIIINKKVFAVWKWIVGVSVSACLIAVGSIITAVICYKKELQKQRQITDSELQNEKKNGDFFKKLFGVDVTLDPDTANPFLIVSADGKQVTCGNTEQDLPHTPQRFTDYRAVLGKKSFSSGRFYYEVQVREKTHWALGVVRENINRKGGITLSPQDGIWTVELHENQYKAHDGPDVPLTLREKVEKVGVFVDYEKGLVSFYDVNSRSHIYSFTGQTFTQKLYPFFHPGYYDAGRNSAPLICTQY